MRFLRNVLLSLVVGTIVGLATTTRCLTVPEDNAFSHDVVTLLYGVDEEVQSKMRHVHEHLPVTSVPGRRWRERLSR